MSVMTVSRAPSDKPEISDKTEQLVLRCAPELGYQPHRQARSLVTRRSSIIGVGRSDIAHSYFAEITFGIEGIIDAAGYEILLCHSRADAVKENAEIDMLVGTRVHGLIIASEQPEESPEVFKELKDRGIPFVLIDRFSPKSDLISVRPDDPTVGRLATRCLIDMAHERIAHIQAPPVSAASIRYRGYLDALKAAGMAVNNDWIVEGMGSSRHKSRGQFNSGT